MVPIRPLSHSDPLSAGSRAVVLQVISIVLMMTTSRAQGLTDHFLGTVAINKAARY